MCQPPLRCVPEQPRHARPRTDPAVTPTPRAPQPPSPLPRRPPGGSCSSSPPGGAARRVARPGRRQGRSARPAPPRLRRVYIRRRFRPAAAAAPPASSPGSARPGPVPCGCPPLFASMRRRRPAACPGHGHQRPLHQLQERGREPRAVSRAGAGRGRAASPGAGRGAAPGGPPQREPLPLAPLATRGKRGRDPPRAVFTRSRSRPSPGR